MGGDEKRSRFRFGPGLMVTAAFVGPGTVVTASKAGMQTGCSLLWVIVLAGIAAVVLQNFAASLGIRSGSGLSEHLRRSLAGSPLLWPMIALVIAAIGVGNAAYQTGNLLGAATGLKEALGGRVDMWALCIATLAGLLLLRGPIELLRWGLGGLVALMSLAFIASAVASWPGLDAVLEGLTQPNFSQSEYPLVLALVGTTVVPYNLFLHASTAATRWKDSPQPSALRESFWDTLLSITLGIIVTGSIIVSANIVAQQGNSAESISVSSLGLQLRPLLGDAATVLFSLGLFAAGMTSSLTAPLATAYAVIGLLGLKNQPATGQGTAGPLNAGRVEDAPAFRWIAIGIIAVGALFAVITSKAPVQAIVLAQIANGMLLPIVAAALMWAATRALGSDQSKQDGSPLRYAGVGLGWLVVLGVTLLSVYRIYGVFS